MQRLAVESSDVVSIGYDEKTRLLEVEFNGGRVYQYIDVEPEVYKHFMRADSFGQYFNIHINSRYRYLRVNESGGKVHKRVAFVTGNVRKFRDFQAACGSVDIDVEQLNLSIAEVQSDNPQKIAIEKAKIAQKLARRPVVVTDTFWNIIALRGFPGAYMKEVASWLRAEDFLKLMEGKTERTVICTNTLVYCDGSRHRVFSQDYAGHLEIEPRGKGCVSIDRIVVMSGHTQTIAEIEDSQGLSSVDPYDGVYGAAAKWLQLQLRLGKL